MNGHKCTIKVSVCITAFNAEQYLPRCLDSILSQSLPCFEVLCVNDGSTDASWSVIERYAAKDKRIRGINRTRNSGEGAGRNIALHAAQGKYVLAVDADDALPPDALAVFYTRAEQTACEAVVGGLEAVGPEGEFLYRHVASQEYIDVNPCEHPELYIYAMGYHVTLFLNREFLLRTGVLYKEGVKCSADGFFLFELFFHLSRVSFITDSTYKYFLTPNSAMRSKHGLDYYTADFSAYSRLYECAEKHHTIHVADIRFSYRLHELFVHDLQSIMNNLPKEEILSLFSFISRIFKTFSIVPRLFKYNLPVLSWLHHPGCLIFLYEIQKGKLDVAFEIAKPKLAGET